MKIPSIRHHPRETIKLPFFNDQGEQQQCSPFWLNSYFYYMRLYFGFLVLLLPIIGYGQNKSAEYRKKAYIQLDKENNYDSAQYYADLLLSESTTDIALADHAVLQGKIHFVRNSFGEAMLAYKKAIAIDSSSYLAPYAHVGLAASQKKVGSLSKSLENYQRARLLFEQQNEQAQIAKMDNLMALLYRNLREYEKAMEIYDRLINFFPTDSKEQASVYNNIGATYYELADYPLALNFHKKANDIADKLDSRRTKALYTHNLGDVYIQLHKYDSAVLFLAEALIMHEELNDYRNVAKVNLLLAQLNLKKGDHTEKIPTFLQKAEGLAKQVKERRLLIDVYQTWIDYLGSIEQYEIASTYYALLLANQDTLLNEEKVRAISELEIKYETEKKEEALNASLAREDMQLALLRFQRNTILSLAVVAGLLLLVGMLIYKLYRSNKREKEKTILLMREQHHRIENNISVLASILSLAAKNTTNEEAKKIAKEGENRLNAINMLHKDLYWNESKIAIQFDEYVEKLCRYQSGIFSGSWTKKIPITTQLEDLNLEVSQAIPLSLIINELLTNALKYGTTNEEPKIEVEIVRQNDNVNLTVRDNGPGIQLTPNSEPSFGMNLVSTLVEQLRGDLTTKSDTLGTSISIVAPMKLG